MEVEELSFYKAIKELTLDPFIYHNLKKGK